MDTKYVDFSFKLTTYMKNGEEKKKFTLPEGWQLLTENLINPSHNGRGRITGKLNNLTVFDFDNEATYEKFMNDHPNININDLKRVKTRHGWHIYFLHDETLKNTTEVFKDYEGVDIRNDGGFITIPPTAYKLLDGTIFEYKEYDGDLIHVPFDFRYCLKSSVIKKPSKIIKEVKEDDNKKLISQILPIIKDMANDYTNWIKVGMALKHSSEDNLNLFHDFSKFCIEKYIEDDVNTAWDRITDGPLNLGSIIYWAKEIDYDATMEIISKYKTDEYSLLKHEWEGVKRLAFIHSTTDYCYEEDGKLLFKRKEDMKNSLANVQFIKNEKETSFFETWNKDKTRKEYYKVDIIPHDNDCPPNVLNLWDGFAVEKIKGSIVPITKILNHIKILCGNNDECYHFIMLWLANFFQYPSQTSVMPLFTGPEGCGKGTLIEFLCLLIGQDKLFTCENMDEDLMGGHNGQLLNVMLVHIEEMDFKTSSKYIERIKSMITRKTISINEKYQKRITVPHYIKYITTANPKYPFHLSENDRRIAPIACSEELKGNNEYFEDFYVLMNDKNIQYSFYKYIMTYKTNVQIQGSDIPETELRNESKIMSRDSIEDFISEFSGTVDSNGFFDMYKDFMKRSNLQCNISLKSFQMKAKTYFDKYKIKVKDVDKMIDDDRIRGKFYYVDKFDESIFENR